MDPFLAQLQALHPVPASQLVLMPNAFVQAVRPMVADTGALNVVNTGLASPKSISFDRLDSVPEIIGPIIDIGAESQQAPIAIEDIRNGDFYEGLQGSGFKVQRAFIQGLLGRLPPDERALQEFRTECDICQDVALDCITLAQHMKGDDTAAPSLEEGALSYLSRFDSELLAIQVAVVIFLRGLAHSTFEKVDRESISGFPTIYLLLTMAARRFSSANLDGAAAISHRLGMFVNRSYATSAFEMRHVINYLGASMMSGRDDLPLGEAYLYALHYSKEARDFDRMQGLLLYSGKVHKAQGLVEEAVRAYVTSLWAFVQRERATVSMRDGAIAALRMIGTLEPRYESGAAAMIEQLREAQVVEDRNYYVDTEMYNEQAARAIADGKPKLADLYTEEAHMNEGHEGD